MILGLLSNHARAYLTCCSCVAKTRPPLTIMARRLNLLPVMEAELARVFDSLAALVGHEGILVLNVGLWVSTLAITCLVMHTSVALTMLSTLGSVYLKYHGPLIRLGRSIGSEGKVPRQAKVRADALALLVHAVKALITLTCSRPTWPRLLWREHLPTHFASGGIFSQDASHKPCTPLADHDAHRMYDMFARPVSDLFENASRSSCKRIMGIMPGFWPLTPRHDDHPSTGRPGSVNVRSDCVHFLPCSGSMMLLNRMLVDALL